MHQSAARGGQLLGRMGMPVHGVVHLQLLFRTMQHLRPACRAASDSRV